MKRPDPAKLEALIADRSGFLRLLTAAPRSKRELTELLDCSRSTIDRVLRSLADAYPSNIETVNGTQLRPGRVHIANTTSTHRFSVISPTQR